MDRLKTSKILGFARLSAILLAAMVSLPFPNSASAEGPSLGEILNEKSATVGSGFALISDDSRLVPVPGTPGIGGIPNDDAVESMVLEQLEEMAVSFSPALQQADAEVMRLKGIWEQVGLKPNPIFGYQAAEVGNEGSAGQQGFFIGQEFVTGDKLQLNRSVAYQAVQGATWQRGKRSGTVW